MDVYEAAISEDENSQKLKHAMIIFSDEK